MILVLLRADIFVLFQALFCPFGEELKNKVKNMTLKEAYDLIDGQYVKDESKYKHYTSIENFHKAVNSLCSGGGLKGSYYPVGTNTFKGARDSKKETELCLVRSDMSPDNIPGFNLSGNIGDIKFTFKEDELVNKFGKIEPINEFPIQNKKFALSELERCNKHRRTQVQLPIIDRKINELKKKIENYNFRDGMSAFESSLKILDIYIEKPYINDLRHELKNLVEKSEGEHMESRVRLGKNKEIGLKYINKIMIPDYLKDNEEIKNDIKKLNEKGFNNISFYKCRYPREKV